MAKEIDLLAGTKRQSAYSEALLRSALSAKPAYSWGEAVARALLGGMAGHIENQEGKENAKLWGDLADAYVASQPSPAMSPMPGQAPAVAAPRSAPVGADVVSEAATPQDYINRAWGGLTPQGRDTAARTVVAEAGGEGPLGMQGVADVMANRAAAGGYRTGSTGPTTMDRVATAPGQFEPHMTAEGRARMAGYSPNSPAYQGAQSAVDNAAIGGQPDVTGGSTFFYAPKLQADLGRNTPAWAAGRQPNTTIGAHQFFSPEGKPAQSIAGQAFAQGPQNVQTDAIVEAIKNPRTSNEMRARLFQMLQRPEADFGVIGEDAEGNKRYGWIDKRRQTTTPAQVPGAAQAAPLTATLPDGTAVTMPQGANPKEWRKNITQNVADAQSGKNTESQSKAAGFASRMEVAMPDIDKYQSAATSAKDNAIAGVPFVPDKVKNYGLSEQFQLYNSAKGRWIAGLLRRDSGAVINPDEFAREDRNFFPQPGDSPSVIAGACSRGSNRSHEARSRPWLQVTGHSEEHKQQRND
jgi:spore germination cell wall hydrolase CwlJ-like protein